MSYKAELITYKTIIINVACDTHTHMQSIFIFICIFF